MHAVSSRKFSENHACGREVSGVLQDHNNWRQPIVPVLPGCPEIVWVLPSFQDFLRFWTCEFVL